MRVVLDTSTVVSGLCWNGPPRQILDLARLRRVELFTSLSLLAELAAVLSRQKFIHRLRVAGVDAKTLVIDYSALARLINQPSPIPRTCRDPDDDEVLACARAAGADLIITGDHDLLSLGDYNNMPIVHSTRGLALISASIPP